MALQQSLQAIDELRHTSMRTFVYDCITLGMARCILDNPHAYFSDMWQGKQFSELARYFPDGLVLGLVNKHSGRCIVAPAYGETVSNFCPLLSALINPGRPNIRRCPTTSQLEKRACVTGLAS